MKLTEQKLRKIVREEIKSIVERSGKDVSDYVERVLKGARLGNIEMDYAQKHSDVIFIRFFLPDTKFSTGKARKIQDKISNELADDLEDMYDGYHFSSVGTNKRDQDDAMAVEIELDK